MKNRVELDPEYQFINGYKQFEGDSFTGDGSQVCGYAFTWGWQHYIVKNDCISILIDSDMFFIKDISFEEMMKDHNLAFIPSYRYSQKYSENSRGQIAPRYPWNGLVIADIQHAKSIRVKVGLVYSMDNHVMLVVKVIAISLIIRIN